MDFRMDGDSLHDPTFLYTPQDDLLGPSLLTPESDLSNQKDNFGDYPSIADIGIYDPYDDSGPSSIRFGDGLDPSEHEGSHVSTNGNGNSFAVASGSNDIPPAASADIGQYARTNGDLHSFSSAKVTKDLKGLKKFHRDPLQESMSPSLPSAPTSSKNTPNKHVSGQKGAKR